MAEQEEAIRGTNFNLKDRINTDKAKTITDRCLTTYVYKGLVGLGAGLTASLLLFKRRVWPVALTTGFGLGMAHNECNRNFKAEYYKQIMDERNMHGVNSAGSRSSHIL